MDTVLSLHQSKPNESVTFTGFLRRINKDRGFRISHFLNAFALAVVVVTTNDDAVLFNLGLFVVTVEDELPDQRVDRVDVLRDVAVRVVNKALAVVEAVR